MAIEPAESPVLSGGNVVRAIELGRRLGPGATVVTIMCDTGLKYLSTGVYGERRNALSG